MLPGMVDLDLEEGGQGADATSGVREHQSDGRILAEPVRQDVRNRTDVARGDESRRGFVCRATPDSVIP
ncbi:hypothetical protein Slala03_74780 [Streptomyces lavendulae subsp. lavendulae]|nr:hypothetical protein Slala03_74780 [Streptomyces lavendulae subsp. lavendulae]